MLTSYNGTTISYDAIGNPTNWRNGITNLTWNGRELNSFVKGSYTHSFEYNADGIRTQKTNWYTGTSMAEIYHYVLDGTKIVSEYRTYASNPTPGNVKYYYYDAAGSIAGFEYNGTTYYFQKNLQGDIIRICNISGNTVVEYTYDAWGKILSIKDGSGNDVSGNASHIANINPFRYRGYYYDTETGFYYLQTRYNDPDFVKLILQISFNQLEKRGITPRFSVAVFDHSIRPPETDTTGVKFIVTPHSSHTKADKFSISTQNPLKIRRICDIHITE